jgi:hypothetical protein
MAQVAVLPQTIPGGVITDKTSVQKDALNLLAMINSRKNALTQKYGAKRIADIGNGLNALAKLTDVQVNQASQKGANLKLITIKAQEVLKGDHEDCLLGAAATENKREIKRPVVKNNASDVNASKTNQIAMALKEVTYWKNYLKKFPKDKYAMNNLTAANKNYANVQAAYQNINKIDSSKIDPGVWNNLPVKTGTNPKLSNPIPKNLSFMDQIQSYLPYIVMGAVVLLLIFSQTKPRTPVRR